ncbi:MAG: GAF domain-containing protein, partial [Nannocystaceae bacterium]
MRLLGEAPWRRPESQLRVHDASAVAARLDALGADQLDSPIRELLIRLLHPEPTERVGDSGQLVTRLCRLHAAADAGLDLRRAEPWWCPARWPYRGPSLAAVLERLRGSERPRLVVVAGSSGVGRGRIVEELVQSLQTEADAPTATMAEPERLPAALGRGGSPWLEAWRRADEDLLVGALEPPTWPSGIDGREALVSRAAVLQQVASQAGATLLLPVAPELAAEASRRGAMVITVEPWTVDEVEGVLDGVVDASTRRAWAQRLHAATGGWPARVVRAAEACAAAQLDDPADPAVLDAVASDDGARLDPGTARAVMLAVWRGAAAIEGLPSHLHDSERPWATVEAVARRTLGTELLELARDVAELVEAEGQSPSLPLAIDAGRPAVIAAALESLRSEPPALAHWLDEGGAGSLPPAAVAAAMRLRLARGDVDAVLRLAPHAHCAQGYLVQARALQRRGELDAALRNAELAEASSSPDPRWSARGLRWRLWIDQGQGARALQDARAALPTAPEHGVGPATARLWAGMAALVGGEHEQALTWLDEAVDATAGVEGAEAAGVRARAHQLHGNLAQAQGQLREAQRRYAQAAVAFEEADEPVGGLMLRGSLAGLAVLAHDFSAGLEHGSAAIGGLLGRGQIAATLEAGLNLVQLLARVGADGQAQALGRLLDQLHGGSETALVVARLQRLRAELLLMRLRPGGRPRGGPVRGLQAAAESGFVAAATALAEVAAVESSEAWRLAAGLARVQGQQVRARSHLDRARAAASDDPDARAELALEAAQQQLVDADPTAVSHVLGRLAALPRPRSWLDRGRVDLALSYDRVLLAALRRRLPPEHPARRRVAQRWLGTLELVMKQTSPLDRDSVRGALLVDGGDSQPLRELLAELDDEAASAAASGPAPARVTTPRAAVPASTEHARAEQQLRIYRRLAREDRLELLLQQVVDSMMDLTDAERGAVVVRATPHTPRLEVTRELAEGSEGVRFSRSVIERVLAEGEPVLSVDAAADDRFDGSRSISHLNLRSVLAVPLRFRGECLGAAYVDHRLRRGNFDEHDLARMEEFAELAALAVAHARALAELRAQAQALETQQAELSRLLEAREAEVIGLREEVRAQGSPRGSRGIIGGTPVM